MTNHTLRVLCSYCGDELETEIREDSTIVSDEYHSCYGQQIGFIGSKTSNHMISCLDVDDFDLVIE